MPTKLKSTGVEFPDNTTQTTEGVTSVSAGSALTGGGSGSSVTINHADTSSQGSVSNSDSDVIQSVTLDSFGHVTGLSSTSISAGGVGTRERLNGSGTFTVPSGIEKIRVFIVGAGGGGAGSDGGASSFGSFSAGGGGGGPGGGAGPGGSGGGSGCSGNDGGGAGGPGGGSGGFGGGGFGDGGGTTFTSGVDGGGGGAGNNSGAGGGGGLNVQDINTSPGASFSYSSGSGGSGGGNGADGGDGFIVVEY